MARSIYNYQGVPQEIDTKIPAAPNPLANKKIIFIGDSISAGAGSGSYTFADAVMTADPSVVCYSYAIGGAYFADKGAQTPNRIITQLATAYSEHPEADAVVIEGGYNDTLVAYTPTNDEYATFTNTSWGGALEELLLDAMKKYPRKKIFFVTQHRTNGWSEGTVQAYINSLKAICNKWGVPLCNNCQEMGYSTEIMDGQVVSDLVQIHPPKWFYEEYFGPRIANFLRSFM